MRQKHSAGKSPQKSHSAKPKTSGQTVLPDMSILIGQNWWKMPKLKNSNATFWVIFKHCAEVSLMMYLNKVLNKCGKKKLAPKEKKETLRRPLIVWQYFFFPLSCFLLLLRSFFAEKEVEKIILNLKVSNVNEQNVGLALRHSKVCDLNLGQI